MFVPRDPARPTPGDPQIFPTQGTAPQRRRSCLVTALRSHPITENREGHSKNIDGRKRRPHVRPGVLSHFPRSSRLPHAERNPLFQIRFLALRTNVPVSAFLHAPSRPDSTLADQPVGSAPIRKPSAIADTARLRFGSGKMNPRA